MSIQAICQTNVVTIGRNAKLKEVADLMQERHVGSVIVTEPYNGKQRPAGIITDRDIALSIGSSANPQDLLVERIMQSKPITAKTKDGIYETISRMRELGIKRMPVTNEDGSLHGVVCADDLLSLMGEEINNLAKITEAQVRKERGSYVPVEHSTKM